MYQSYQVLKRLRINKRLIYVQGREAGAGGGGGSG